MMQHRQPRPSPTRILWISSKPNNSSTPNKEMNRTMTRTTFSKKNKYRVLRPIGYCRFELNVWVWRSFFGLIRSPKTGLFLTFWKVNRRDSRRSGRLQKNTVLVKINGKNSKNCLSLSNCVISNPLERKFFGYCVH